MCTNMADSSGSHTFGNDGDADKFITAYELDNGFRFVRRKAKLCGLTSVTYSAYIKLKSLYVSMFIYSLSSVSIVTIFRGPCA